MLENLLFRARFYKIIDRYLDRMAPHAVAVVLAIVIIIKTQRRWIGPRLGVSLSALANMWLSDSLQAVKHRKDGFTD